MMDHERVQFDLWGDSAGDGGFAKMKLYEGGFCESCFLERLYSCICPRSGNAMAQFLSLPTCSCVFLASDTV
jgi:hypothetical protein